jgi:diaminopimelate epimerase
MTIPAIKMNGLGNEILVVDLRGQRSGVSGAGAARVAKLPGLHFDQMMVLKAPRTSGTLAAMTIFNTDGSEAEACGNGTRCVAVYLAGETGLSKMTLETTAALLECSIEADGQITVDMGRPRFGWQDIPLVEAFHDTRRIELQVGPIDKPILHSPSVVNVGNPHCIFWVDRLDIVDLGKVGPMLEHHRLFPEGANISLARVASPEEIELKVWERGAGLTKACGSAACAAAVAAVRKGLTGRKVRVALPGGPLGIHWRDDDRILMTGPVELERRHQLDPALLEAAAIPV